MICSSLKSLSFHEVCGLDITTQTPVQACLLFGEQVTGDVLVDLLDGC